MVSIRSIIEMMRKTERSVFSVNDMSIIGRLDNRSAKVYASRAIRSNLLSRIERGKYAIGNDPFSIASQLVFPSYISFLSALSLHGLIDQAISRIVVATSKRKKKMSVFGNDIEFIRLNSSMMFGFRKVKRGNGFIVIAEPEKAIIDLLYIPTLGPISYIADIVKDMDAEKLQEYALKTGSEAVIRRTGFLLDRAGIGHSLKPSSYNAYKLNPSIKRNGEFNTKWRLFINEVL